MSHGRSAKCPVSSAELVELAEKLWDMQGRTGGNVGVLNALLAARAVIVNSIGEALLEEKRKADERGHKR
jgi:ADP-dependent phosphofructokinase/glucokinase